MKITYKDTTPPSVLLTWEQINKMPGWYKPHHPGANKHPKAPNSWIQVVEKRFVGAFDIAPRTRRNIPVVWDFSENFVREARKEFWQYLTFVAVAPGSTVTFKV